MPTNYVLFIHGTNVREVTYADELRDKIQQIIPIKPLVVYWGDLSTQEEDKLLTGYKAAKDKIWNKVWFRELREQLLLRFIGDATLYLSRHIGAGVVKKVAEQILQLKCSAGDRLHLVTHSLGTVILFDLLFSSRWDDDVESRQVVEAIREMVYGLYPNPDEGFRLGSISTMGSPIGLFSLTHVESAQGKVSSTHDGTPTEVSSTHDITPSLMQLLPRLRQELGKKLPWRNFVHPGDPIASPLTGIIPNLVDEHEQYIDIQDILVPVNLAEVFKEPLSVGFPDLLTEPVQQKRLAVLDSGNAHGSYWKSSHVSKAIAEMIGGGGGK